jgi:hypothetical protein
MGVSFLHGVFIQPLQREITAVFISFQQASPFQEVGDPLADGVQHLGE